MQDNLAHPRIISGALCLLLLSSCASYRNGPFLGARVDDPPALSPYNRSLTQDDTSGSVPYQAARPLDSLGTQLGAPESIPESTDTGGVPEPTSQPPQTIHQRPERNDLQAPDPGATTPGPQLGRPEAMESSGSGLVLTVGKPDNVLISESATFKIVIRNSQPTPATDVVIECRFGDGLSFPGSTERGLRQQIGTLGADEVRTIDLSLETDRAGTHCIDFLVTATNRDETTGRQCITCVEPTVTVDLVGPPVRSVGGRLECVLSLVNVTGREVSGVVASISHDSALVPHEISAGATRNPGRLDWDLGLLQADERVQIQVEFACPTTTEQTCIAAKVVGRDMQAVEREMCVVIRPQHTLDVAVADARDPLPVGETTTYLVTVTNRGLEALRDLRLDVELDGGLEIIRAGDRASDVSSGTKTAPVTATIPIAGPIAPDDSRTVQVDVRAVKVGQGNMRVSVTEADTDVRVTADEPTVINPPLLNLPSFEEFVGKQALP